MVDIFSMFPKALSKGEEIEVATRMPNSDIIHSKVLGWSPSQEDLL
jgi:hypothetical protein